MRRSALIINVRIASRRVSPKHVKNVGDRKFAQLCSNFVRDSRRPLSTLRKRPDAMVCEHVSASDLNQP